MIKLLIVLICSVLFWVGGKWWHNARRYIMPMLLGITCAIVTKTWWILPSIFIPMAGALCLGYGEDSPFYKIFGNTGARIVWGLLVGFAATAVLFFCGFMHLYFWIPYLVLSATLEPLLKDINENIADPIIGLGFGILVFLL